MADPSRKKARNRQPLSRHPLFPATVALWTGAVFGLGGLALAPPSGTAPRIAIAIAIVAAALGAFVGLQLARRAGQASGAAAAAAKSTTLDSETSALWTDLRHSRALAETETAPAIAEPMPLVDRVPEILDVTSVAIDSFEDAPTRAVAMADDLDQVLAPTTGEVAVPDPAPPIDAAAAPATSAAERIAAADLDTLSHVELLERLALSMLRRGARASALTPSGESRSEAPAAPADSPEGDDEAIAEQGYSSLLNLGRRAGPGPADGGETELVFPGRAERRSGPVAGPQDSAEAEKALRDALAALQKMSGAA